MLDGKISYQDLIREEYKKCLESPVYFMKQYVKIKHPMRGTILFDLFKFQEETLQAFHDYKFNIILKSRQMGISTLVASYSLWLMIFHKDKTVLLISLKQDDAKDVLTKVRDAYKELPNWLKIQCSEDNRLSIRFSNGSRIQAASTTKKSGVGQALSLLIIDEAALIEDAEDLWTSAQPTLSTGGNAIVLSTPRGVGGWFHKIWQGASDDNQDGTVGRNGFHPITLPWQLHPERDDEWRRIEGEKQGNPKKASQEYDCNFLSSGDNVVDLNIIEFYKKNKACDPVECRGMGKNLWIWEYPDRSHVYVVCLPSGESVLTEMGVKRIEDVTYEDKLIDKDGYITNIEDIKVRLYNGKIYEITPSNTFRTTKFTDEHPIFVSQTSKLNRMYKKDDINYRFNQRYWEHDFKFVDAKDVKKNDWIRFPNIYTKNKLDSLSIMWKEFENIGRIDFQIKDNPFLNEDFWWFVGIWLAEGWCYTDKSGNVTIHTAHNSSETIIINKLRRIVFDLFDRTLLVMPTENNTTVCQFGSKQIGTLLEKYFGKYAGGKFISERIKYISQNEKIQLINGYIAGDGCVLANKRGAKSIKITSISLRLLEDIQDMLFSLGCVSSLNLLRVKKQAKIREKNINQKQAYSLTISDYGCKCLILGHLPKSKSQRTADCYLSPDNQYIYFRVKKVKEMFYCGEVHNFTTKSGTFLCENITTHNCADVARGDGADYSACHVLDISREKPVQVAEYKGKISTKDFGDFLVALATEYNSGLLVIERENVGWGTIQEVLDRGYPNTFYSSADLKYVEVQRQLNNNWAAEDKKLVPGFSTNVRTRPLIVDNMEHYMRHMAVEIRSKRTLAELETFVWKNGKQIAMEGYNDDLTMALCIGLWVRDTALRLRQEGVELTKIAVSGMTKDKMDQTPFYKVKQAQTGHNAWTMNTGRQGFGKQNQEDLRWLIG